MSEIYNPGLHILLEIKNVDSRLLIDHSEFRRLVEEQIEIHELSTVGNVWHSFENGGFTAAVCLTESHLSIHTWPEFNNLTFDVFLSNFQKNNDSKTRSIAAKVITYFGSPDYTLKEVTR